MGSAKMGLCFRVGLVALFFVSSEAMKSLGLSCKDHAAYFPGLKPVLVKSWEILHYNRAAASMYHAAYEKHMYAPENDNSSVAYDKLDWFWAVKGGPSREKYVKLTLQRPAKIFLLVQYKFHRKFPFGRLKGWESVGYMQLMRGRGQPFEYGVHQKNVRFLSSRMFMFSRMTSGEILLPNISWLSKNIRGIEVNGDWIVMVAEQDGSRPLTPESPPGVAGPILPNVRCPDELHDLWVTPNTDDSDPDTAGKMWRTWHPQWDPCYWCAYDHEHGSSPKHLMGYEPKFNLAAWKNGREAESHQGYKGIVFRYGSIYVYYMLHVQTSSLRRVTQPRHTILLAVTDAETKELLAEITHKGDFGFVATRRRSGGFLPLSREQRIIRETQLYEAGSRNMRSINVIDWKSLDPRYLYRSPKREMMRGVYEGWTTSPMCSAAGRDGMITMDVTAAATGIRSPARRDEKVILGLRHNGRFFRQTGAARILKVNRFTFGEEHCLFKLRNIYGGQSNEGYFYTDPYGVKLMAGPGPYSVRQFMADGFQLNVTGKFEAVEFWTGLYEKGAVGHIVNYGYGLDPDVN